MINIISKCFTVVVSMFNKSLAKLQANEKFKARAAFP